MTLLPPVVPSTHSGLSPGPSSSPSESLPALACVKSIRCITFAQKKFSRKMEVAQHTAFAL
eukprot:2218153-Ditylum_brightwellii.AAC.1